MILKGLIPDEMQSQLLTMEINTKEEFKLTLDKLKYTKSRLRKQEQKLRAVFP